jgi:NAD(P)-dependent dehydrogenase (short-subunit alcohol dehydrogenase family)
LIVEIFKREYPSAAWYDTPADADLCWGLADGLNLFASRLPKVTAHYADVSDPESVNSCVAEIIGAHGKIDNLVTSAGFTENFEAINYPIDRMRKLWAVNVDGTHMFATAVARSVFPYRHLSPIVVICGFVRCLGRDVSAPETLRCLEYP